MANKKTKHIQAFFKNLLLYGIAIWLVGSTLVGCNSPQSQEEPTATQNLALTKPYRPVYKPEVSFEIATKRADSLVALMSTEQKLNYIAGYENFFFRPIPELGIPLIYLTDASQGVHIRPNLPEKLFKQMDSSIAFAAPIALTASWDTALAARYAQAVGQQCRAAGIHVLLGPGLNMYRNPECGRNFEYMGEDPYLTARLVENYVVGMQSTGTMATLKHFVANNSEYLRKWSNSIIDKRALNEIYLPGFKAGVEAGALGVMTAYNLLNGQWCGQSKTIIDSLLRGELGYQGLVMTDWNSVWDAEKIITSGQNIEMPKGKYLNTEPTAASLLAQGKIKESQIDSMVQYLLRACIMQGLFDRQQRKPELLQAFAQHEQLALKTAAEGMVLLKNQDGLLPLNKNTKIVQTGKSLLYYSKDHGSAKVEGYGNITLRKAMPKVFANHSYAPTPTQEQLTQADVLLVTTGTIDGEGKNRSYHIENEDSLTMLCKAHPNTVVVVYSGGGLSTAKWAPHAKAILHAWYPGQNGNEAIVQILAGDINPSGKLPISIHQKIEHSVAYGPLSAGDSAAWGYRNKKKLGYPDKVSPKPVYDVNYKEGIFTGYRNLEKNNIKPAYAFGYGLSYTTYKYANLQVLADSLLSTGVANVTFTIKNTGKMAGKEIAQVYISDPEASHPRPLKELKGFAKVHLNPGEQKTVTVCLTPQDFKYYNPDTNQWVLEKGTFGIHVGAASDNILLSQNINL